MDMILTIIMAAIVIEALIEYGKSIGKAFESGEKKTAFTQLIAIFVSVLLCFSLGMDLFAVVGLNFNLPFVGIILTAIIMSRGSNYLSDFISKLGTVHK